MAPFKGPIVRRGGIVPYTRTSLVNIVAGLEVVIYNLGNPVSGTWGFWVVPELVYGAILVLFIKRETVYI